MKGQSFIRKLLDLSNKHAMIVIVITLLLTVFFGYFASGIKLDANIESLLPKDEEVSRLMKKYSDGDQTDEYLIIAIEDKNLYEIDKLQHFAEVLEKIEEIPDIRSGITPFNMPFFQKTGRKIEQVPFSREIRAPETEDELKKFIEVMETTELIKRFLVSDDETVLAAFFSVKNRDSYTELMRAINNAVSGSEEFFTAHVSGSVPFLCKSEEYISRDLSILMLVSILVIITIYYLSFRAKRAIILPIGIVLMGTIWSIGFMSLLDFSLSFVSVITPPLVLTLGSSYSIHILNQYYRESGEGKTKEVWIPAAVEHITKTILLASLTTLVGFLSLLITSTSQIKEFAIGTSFGIFSCALLSLFFFPAVLSYLRPPPEAKRKKMLEGPFTKLMHKTGGVVVKYRYIILLSLAAVFVLFFLLRQNINYNLDTVSYFPKKDPVIEDMEFLTEKFGGFEQVGITITAVNGENKFLLKPENLAVISRLQEKLSANPDISYNISFVDYLRYMNRVMNNEDKVPDSPGFILYISRFFSLLTGGSDEDAESGSISSNSLMSNFVNDDFTRMTITLRVYDSKTSRFINEKSTRRILGDIKRIIEESLPVEFKAEIWGNSFRYLTLFEIFNSDLQKSLLISILLVFLIASMAFRSAGYGFFAIVPLLNGVMSNFILMALFKIPMDMTTIMVSSIGVGVGVDNAIHFIIQFRRQIKENDVIQSIRKTLVITGRPILLTTVSIISGLLVLSLSSFKPIIYFGVLVVFTLSTTCIGTVLILPAFLIVWKGFFKKRDKKLTK